MKWKTKNIPNYLEPEKVVMIKNGVSCEVPFEVIGGCIVIDRYDDTAEYHLKYKPRLERITAGTPSSTYVEVDERIASYIPYFIMGELYKHDEPSMAAEMRNEYEQYMLTLKPKVEVRQTEVVDDLRW